MANQVTAHALANMLGLEASVNSYCAYLRAMAASRGGEDAAEARARLGLAQATLAATKAKR